MLVALAGLAGFVPALADLPVPGLIIWDQYRNFVEWSLDSLADLFGSAGLAVIAFTILVKTALVPLTVQSLRSSKAMQDLQPKINELRKKHGKDRQALSQATMQLYSQHRVNPLAGCLPMLIQIPIFFGLYRAIVNLSGGEGLWDQSFLWLPSLDEADPYKILPIAAGAFQFVQTKMMRPYRAPKITDPQQAMMNQMLTIMPLTVVIFGWGFASGPVLYWATQSVYSVVQQWFITGWGSMRDWFPRLPELPEHRRLGYRAPRTAEEMVVVSGGEGARPGGFGGWMQRKMEDAQRAQEARVQARGGEGPQAHAGGNEVRGGGEVRGPDGQVRRKTGSAKVAGAAVAGAAVATQAGRRAGERGGNGARRGGNPQGGAAATASRGAGAGANGDDPTPAGGPPPVPRKSRSAKRRDGGRG